MKYNNLDYSSLLEIWEKKEEKANKKKQSKKNNKNTNPKKQKKKKGKGKNTNDNTAAEWLAYNQEAKEMSEDFPKEVVQAQAEVEKLWVEASHKTSPEKSFYVRPKNWGSFMKILRIRDRLMSLSNRNRNLLEKNGFFRHIFCVGWSVKTIHSQGNEVKYAARPDGKPNFRLFALKTDGRVVTRNLYNEHIFMFVQKSGKKYFTCLTGKMAEQYTPDGMVEYCEAKCNTAE